MSVNYGATERRTNCKRLLCLFVCSVGNLLTGHILGFSAVFIPKLPELSLFETSTIAGCANLAQIFGALFGGFVAGAFGRRNAIVIFSAFVAAGWLFIGFSDGNAPAIIIGRVITGFGIMTSAVQVYLCEISPPSQRGIFGASGPIMVSTGLVMVYLEGTYIFHDWRWICHLNSALATSVVISALAFLPESPKWLEYRKKPEKARMARIYLGLKWEESEKDRVEERFNFCVDIRKASTVKPLALILSLFFLVQMSGFNAILAFAVSLCRDKFNFADDSPVIIIGVMRLLGGILGLFILPNLPRRTLFISSAVCSSICLILLAGLTAFAENVDVLTVALICLVLISCGAGFGAIPWFLAGELTRTKIRGFASGCAICSAYFSSFVSVFSFEYCVNYLGVSATFASFAGFCAAAAFIAALFLPETRNISEEQIEILWK